MPIDREDALKKAEKLLRQGRLEAAIAEYVRVADDQPRDWTTANTLGDLYARAGLYEKAAKQYTRIAEHFDREGFYSKAAALFKKILKLSPDDEAAQLQLAELSVKQGLLADAKVQFASVADRRRSRGDRRGADEIVIRLGALDPSDFEAQRAAARALADGGDAAGAAERFRALSSDLFERNREREGVDALRSAVELDPADVGGRARLARVYLGMGDVAHAREFLDAEAAGTDPGLLLALAQIELNSGRYPEAKQALGRALEIDASLANDVVNIGWSLSTRNPDAAFACISVASNAAIARGDYQTGAQMLQEYVARSAAPIPPLLRLVEVCVDGGLEEMMYETQAQLCDAYLASGQAGDARVIAEDLVAREPWEQQHLKRFRQALTMLRVSDPDTVIAERLNGQVPFIATDRFPSQPAPEPAAPSAAEPPWPVRPTPPTAAPPGARQTPAQHHTLEVDLTSALLSLDAASQGAMPPPPKSLDDAFSRARESAGRQPGAEEAREQLRLARTYLDMGLLDDGIKALERAARSPRHRFEAAATLGRLYRQRNQTQQAVEWMERAVEAPAPSADEGRAVLYELGVALEDTGETARALAVFLELQSDAGSFRDVQARVIRLSRVEAGD